MHASLGRTDLEYNAWDTLGFIELHLGDHARAIAHFETALAMCREHGDRYSEAEILTHVGDARHTAGGLPRARHAWQQALDIYDDLRHPGADKVRAKLASACGEIDEEHVTHADTAIGHNRRDLVGDQGVRDNQ
jgi:tetratricopeptide (TPR) repeat protein